MLEVEPSGTQRVGERRGGWFAVVRARSADTVSCPPPVTNQAQNLVSRLSFRLDNSSFVWPARACHGPQVTVNGVAGSSGADLEAASWSARVSLQTAPVGTSLTVREQLSSTFRPWFQVTLLAPLGLVGAGRASAKSGDWRRLGRFGRKWSRERR